MTIGWIGLGIMGKPMAKNLLRAGHTLAVYDLVQAAVDELAAAGARPADSAADAARGSEAVITMLPNSPQVREVVLGPRGVLEGAVPGTIVMDMSSIAPVAAQEIAAACAQKGVTMLDCPVSGGEPKAIDGTLSIMCGGDTQTFVRMEKVLLAMGASAVLVGDIGSGNITKLVNQIIVALNIAAVGEAFSLAAKAGVDLERVYAAIRGGLAGSTVLDAKGPMMLAHNFQPGFRIGLHSKDLMNVMETAHAIDTPLPLSAQVLEMMQSLKVDGLSDLDHSALSLYFERLSKVNLSSA